jgi:threonine dehydrogenase-like Zn-dependent dehydrogenase
MVFANRIISSELHVFRGHQPSPIDFIMGHEFTGTVVETGQGIKTLKKGDQVVSPFTICWLEALVTLTHDSY